MNNARLRQAVKPDYLNALGQAAYCFALCEWQVVYCCDKIRPGSLRKFLDEELTAGVIAKQFLDLTRNMPKSKGRENLKTSADKFESLVKKRNQILHGKPCTGPSGESRLSFTKVIEIPDLENAADEFSQCSIELNQQFYDFLASYVSQYKS